MNCAFKITKSTDKAIAIKAWGRNCDNGKDVSFDYWVPKSLIGQDGSIPGWFVAKKDEELLYSRDIEHIIFEVA